MSSKGRPKGLGLKIGVPSRGIPGGSPMPHPQPLPLPKPQPVPLPLPLPLPPDSQQLAHPNTEAAPQWQQQQQQQHQQKQQQQPASPASGRPPAGRSGRPSLAPLQGVGRLVGSGSGRALFAPAPNPITVFTPREDVRLEDLERIQPPLGFGSGGRVYKVRHRTAGKEYALKIIQERYDEDVRKQIVQEMQILRRAHCDFIVECYGIFDHMGEISFVLELMDGGTLGDVVKRKGPIPEQHMAEVARQVLQGLLYLHRQHVVHRDIKPSNLLINTRGQVKIADFGVSKSLANTLELANSYVGTSAYLSPERINPQAGVGYDGYSSDVWSFGLTLLELALGRFPYVQAGQSADWMTLFGAIVFNDPPRAPDHCSPEFRSFIEACLQKEPRARSTVASLLEHPFCLMYREPQWMDLRPLVSP